MTLQQDLGGGGFPLFPEMEFCLLCFSLFHRIVEIDLLDGEIFIIWGYLYMALYADYTFTDWWKYSTIIPQIVKINMVGFFSQYSTPWASARLQ